MGVCGQADTPALPLRPCTRNATRSHVWTRPEPRFSQSRQVVYLCSCLVCVCVSGRLCSSQLNQVTAIAKLGAFVKGSHRGWDCGEGCYFHGCEMRAEVGLLSCVVVDGAVYICTRYVVLFWDILKIQFKKDYFSLKSLSLLLFNSLLPGDCLKLVGLVKAKRKEGNMTFPPIRFSPFQVSSNSSSGTSGSQQSQPQTSSSSSSGSTTATTSTAGASQNGK